MSILSPWTQFANLNAPVPIGVVFMFSMLSGATITASPHAILNKNFPFGADNLTSTV